MNYMPEELKKITPEEKEAESVEEPKDRGAVLREREQARTEREEQIYTEQKQLSTESVVESIRIRKKILYGKIIGCEELTKDDDVTVCASLLMKADNSVKVCVPFEEMFIDSPMDMSTVNTDTADGRKRFTARKKQMLAKMVGLDIPVRITDIEKNYDGEGHNLIYASRSEACRAMRSRAYYGKNPKIAEGQTYNATILTVSTHSLAASLEGIDFKCNQNTLTGRFLTDLQMHYQPGDSLPVMIRGIKFDGDNVELTVDTITPELEEARSRWYLISVGTIATATITRVRNRRSSDGIDITAWIEHYNMPCKIMYMDANSFGREPVLGDKVQVSIAGFLPNGYLSARCRALQGNAGIFYNF